MTKEKEQINEEWLQYYPTIAGASLPLRLRATLDFFFWKIEEKIKAFGGCKLCYGKGYATTKVQASSCEDFGGEGSKTWDLNPYRICSCDRGNQFAQALDHERGNERHRIGNALQAITFKYPELAEQFRQIIHDK